MGLKRPWRDPDHSPPPSIKATEWLELYFCSFSGILWPLTGRNLPFLPVKWQVANVSTALSQIFRVFCLALELVIYS